MMFVGFPYSLAWYWVFAIIGWAIVGGATAGAIYKTAPAVQAEAAPAF